MNEKPQAAPSRAPSSQDPLPSAAWEALFIWAASLLKSRKSPLADVLVTARLDAASAWRRALRNPYQGPRLRSNDPAVRDQELGAFVRELERTLAATRLGKSASRVPHRLGDDELERLHQEIRSALAMARKLEGDDSALRDHAARWADMPVHEREGSLTTPARSWATLVKSFGTWAAKEYGLPQPPPLWPPDKLLSACKRRPPASAALAVLAALLGGRSPQTVKNRLTVIAARWKAEAGPAVNRKAVNRQIAQ